MSIDPLQELEEKEKKRNPLLRIVLLLCWALVLAKTFYLLSGRPTPWVIEWSYVIALPTVLWNLKVGLEILGTWFYIGVLSFIGAGAVMWVVRSWRRYLTEDPKSLPIEWTIGTTILAVNFVILIFFVGRELLINASKDSAPEFDEPPTHPAPPSEGNGGRHAGRSEFS